MSNQKFDLGRVCYENLWYLVLRYALNRSTTNIWHKITQFKRSRTFRQLMNLSDFIYVSTNMINCFDEYDQFFRRIWSIDHNTQNINPFNPHQMIFNIWHDSTNMTLSLLLSQIIDSHHKNKAKSKELCIWNLVIQSDIIW